MVSKNQENKRFDLTRKEEDPEAVTEMMLNTNKHTNKPGTVNVCSAADSRWRLYQTNKKHDYTFVQLKLCL